MRSRHSVDQVEIHECAQIILVELPEGFTCAVKMIEGTRMQRRRVSFLFVFYFSNNLTHAGEEPSKVVLDLFGHPTSAILLICNTREHLELPQTCK